MTSKVIYVINAVHRGAFFQFPFRWIYYCHSRKFAGEENEKTHRCAVLQSKKQVLRAYCPAIYCEMGSVSSQPRSLALSSVYVCEVPCLSGKASSVSQLRMLLHQECTIMEIKKACSEHKHNNEKNDDNNKEMHCFH